jgi:Flp pilus assembly protein TadD
MPHLEAALAKRGDDPKLYNSLGLAHDLAGRHDLAQAAYRKGLAVAPGDLALRNNLGLSQALAEDFPAAINTLSTLAAMPAATARHRQNLALVYGLAHENAKAAAVARTDLDEASVKNNLAYYAMLRGLSPEARTAAIFGGQLRRPEGASARD